MNKGIPVHDDSSHETPPQLAENHPMAHQVQSTPSRLKKMRMEMNQQRLIIVILALIAVVGTGYFGYKYHQSQNKISQLSNPQESAKEEVRRITTAVGNLVDIPKDETPTVATVSDASKLKNQAFFAKAENGDKVLIFSKAKLAILYRPSTNKVIQIAPLNIGKNQSNTSSSNSTTTGTGTR